MDGTVLVADDDRTIRTVLTQALTRAGCKVHATSSLMTLMRWVEEGKGDLVISDVIMPDGNGLDALPRISKMRPGLPVIVISAQNTIMTAIQAAEAEAYDYLPKPFDLPDLMKRSARALALARERMAAARQASAAAAGRRRECRRTSSSGRSVLQCHLWLVLLNRFCSHTLNRRHQVFLSNASRGNPFECHIQRKFRVC